MYPVIPAAPSTLPENYAVFAFKDLEVNNFWDSTTGSAEYHGGIKLDYAKQYGGVEFALPNKVEISEYGKMIVTVSSATLPNQMLQFRMQLIFHCLFSKNTRETQISLVFCHVLVK